MQFKIMNMNDHADNVFDECSQLKQDSLLIVADRLNFGYVLKIIWMI